MVKRKRTEGKKETVDVEILDVSDVQFDERNPRSHPERNLEVIEQSVTDLGFSRSIVIDEDNKLIAGEGATKGATRAGLKRVMVVDVDGETIVAVRRTGLSDAQKDKLKVVDNRTTELSTWNNEILVEFLQAHADDPAKLASTGFNDEDLLHLLEGIEVNRKDLSGLFADGGGFTDGDPVFKLTFAFADEDLFTTVKEKLTALGDSNIEAGLLKALKI